MSLEGINVCIRVRPFIQREIDAKETDGNDWIVDGDNNFIQSAIPGKKQMNFDRVFDNFATNSMVYEEAAQRSIESALQGMNTTVLCYGQTSSGKTFTMSSIMKSSFSDIFSRIRSDKSRKYEVSCSYCEVYNENITDLADVSKTNLAVSLESGIVRDLTIRPVISEAELLKFHEEGTKNRKVGATKMNAESSRSHSIFQVFIKSSPQEDTLSSKSALPPGVRSKQNTSSSSSTGTLEATINFVDLAGSERASQTQATGDRLQEGAQINKSLLVLGKVIRTLSKRGNEQPPYRESKLTQLLRRSLGGNCRTTMICCVTMAKSNVSETSSTLSFAVGAKQVVNTVGVNEILDDKQLVARMHERYAVLRHKFLQCVEMLKTSGIALPGEIDSFATQLSLQKGVLTKLPPSTLSTSTISPLSPSGGSILEQQLGALSADFATLGSIEPILKKSKNGDALTSNEAALVQLANLRSTMMSKTFDTCIQPDFSFLQQLMGDKSEETVTAPIVSKKRKSAVLDDDSDDTTMNDTMTVSLGKKVHPTVQYYEQPKAFIANTSKIMELLGYITADESLHDFLDQDMTQLDNELTQMLVANGFTDVKQFQEQVTAKDAEIVQLKSQYDELHHKFTKMCEELEQMSQDSTANYEQKVLKLEQTIQEQRDHIKVLESSSTTRELDLQRTNTQLTIEKQTKEQEWKILQEQFTSLSTQHQSQLTAIATEFHAKEQEYLEQLELLTNKLDIVTQDYAMYKEDSETMLNDNDVELKRQLEAMENDKDEEIEELRQKNEKLRLDYKSDYQTQAKQFEERRKALVAEIEELEDQSLRDQTAFEQALKEAEIKYTAQIDTLRFNLDRAEKKNIEFEGKIQFLTAENQNKLNLVNELRSQKEKELDMNNERIKSLAGDKDKIITTMENELYTLKQYQSQQSTLYDSLSNQYKQLESETTQFKKEASELRVQLATKEHELLRIRQRAEDVAKKQREDTETLIKRSKEKLAKVQSDVQTELERKDGEISRLKELQQQFSTKVKKSIQELKEERDTFSKQAEVKEKEKRRVESDYDALRLKCSDITRQLQSMKQEISKSREQQHSLESAVSEEANLKKFHIQEGMILKKQLQQYELRYNDQFQSIQQKYEQELKERSYMIQKLENQSVQKNNELEYYKQSNQETINKLGQAMAEVQSLKMQLQQAQTQQSIFNSNTSLPSSFSSTSSSVQHHLNSMPSQALRQRQQAQSQIYQDADDESLSTLTSSSIPRSFGSSSSSSGPGLSSSPFKRMDLIKPIPAAAAPATRKPEVVKFAHGRTTRATARRVGNDENHQ